MGNRFSDQSYQQLRDPKPAGNVARIHELVVKALEKLTMRTMEPYHSVVEESTLLFLEAIFIQLGTIYIADHPRYENFLPSPPYSPEGAPEGASETSLTGVQKKKIFKKYLIKSIEFLNTFCNEYSELFPSN